MGFALSFSSGDVALLGVPLPRSSPNAGVELAPDVLRKLSYSLDTYSFLQASSLEDISYADLGDFSAEEAGKVGLSKAEKVLFLGGVHSITPALVKAYSSKHPELIYVHVDAHADFFPPDKVGYRHASTAFLVEKLLGKGRVFQFGLSSVNKEELRENQFPALSSNLLDVLPEEKPIYLSIDLDVLSPGFFPSTSTPDGVHSLQELFDFLLSFPFSEVVAVDIVEYNPLLDVNFIGGKNALAVIREVLVLLSQS